jgi:AraC family transcriptional regulator
MASQNSFSEYERRMHRVVEHIDQHLDQPLDLGVLAEVAHFSPFHFHRLFSAWMGETLGDYLRRRKVEVAAMRLAAQPRVSILQTALSVGFGSAEAFARAFKARFGRSPTSWKREQTEQRLANSKRGQMDRKMGQAPAVASTNHGLSRNTHPELPMNVRLIDRQPTTIAYRRYVGPYGDPVSQFWQKTVYPWLAANGLLEQPRYGISHDDPGITAPEQCRYDAGVEVPPQLVPSGNAFKTTIPGGRYAARSFKGTAAVIAEAWTAVLRDWLPSSGLQLDARPCFEYYPKGSTYDPATGVFECEICIPVVPL